MLPYAADSAYFEPKASLSQVSPDKIEGNKKNNKRLHFFFVCVYNKITLFRLMYHGKKKGKLISIQVAQTIATKRCNGVSRLARSSAANTLY